MKFYLRLDDWSESARWITSERHMSHFQHLFEGAGMLLLTSEEL